MKCKAMILLIVLMLMGGCVSFGSGYDLHEQEFDKDFKWCWELCIDKPTDASRNYCIEKCMKVKGHPR